MHQYTSIGLVAFAALTLVGCGSPEAQAGEDLAESGEDFRHARDAEFTLFSFSSYVSRSGEGPTGDVRLDSVTRDGRTWSQNDLQTVEWARILVDDGVDEARGGHNLASGRGIDSELDGWE